jgi:HK97 family phage portal protein
MLERLFERRAITFQSLFASGQELPRQSLAGVTVNQDTALRLEVFYACVRIISDTISSLPVDTFVRFDGQRRPYRPRPAWVDNPEPDQSIPRSDHLGMVLCSLMIDGNAFVRIIRSPSTQEVVALSVLDPNRVIVRRNRQGRIEYVIDHGAFVVAEDDMRHITELRKPGHLRGVSRVEELKETLGLTGALEQFAARFFGSGSTTSGVIEVPGDLNAEQAARIQDGWEQAHRGLRRAHRPSILAGGAKFMKTGVDPNEAQMLESRQFAVESLARAFRIPPHMLQVTRPGAMSYASVEENARQFVTFTLLPYISKIEEAYSSLLPDRAFLRFNVDGLLRGSLQDRYQAYSIGTQAGFLSINDIHRLEDMTPVDGGDAYRVPLANVNLQAADLVETSKRVEMAQRLVYCGFDPASVLQALGLPSIEHTGVPSTQLQALSTLDPINPPSLYEVQ